MTHPHHFWSRYFHLPPWTKGIELDESIEKRIDEAEEHVKKELDTIPMMAVKIEEVMEESQEVAKKDHLAEKLARLFKR